MLTALACGVPQLVMPSGTDRFVNAAALRPRGAGSKAEPESVDAGVIQRLLDDGALRRTAGKVQAEIVAMPHRPSW
jgi:UDP:flavonoid glycosyltransferase YjiC (YdhE family)